MNFTRKEQAYLDELAAQIVGTHGTGAADVLQADPIALLTAAHEQRQDFAQEMLDGTTDRAQKARIALNCAVHIALRSPRGATP